MSPSGDIQLDPDDTANMVLAFIGDHIDQGDRINPHLSTADVELDPDDTANMVLPLAANRGENESDVRPGSSCANLEVRAGHNPFCDSSQ
ncbi:unnamed protein product [Leuciscus chuanchicus]